MNVAFVFSFLLFCRKQKSCSAAGAANEVNYICSDYISRSAAVCCRLLQSAAGIHHLAAVQQPGRQMRVITIQLRNGEMYT